MQAPYRMAAPPEPERTPEADSYEARLLAGRKRYWAQMGLLFASALVVTVTLVKVSRAQLSGAEKAHRQEALRIDEARGTVREARTELERLQAAFDDEVRAAITKKLAPSLPLAACHISLGDPERLVRGQSTVPLLVVNEGVERPHYWSPALERVRGDISTAASLVESANPMAAMVYTDALVATPVHERVTRDVVLVTSRWKAPTRSSDTAFQPGQVDGIAYVFDFATRKIACAGEVHASSSRALEYSYSEVRDARGQRLDQTLQEDLDRQVARSVAEPNVLFAIR